jgi:hypothetical protein
VRQPRTASGALDRYLAEGRPRPGVPGADAAAVSGLAAAVAGIGLVADR